MVSAERVKFGRILEVFITIISDALNFKGWLVGFSVDAVYRNSSGRYILKTRKFSEKGTEIQTIKEKELAPDEVHNILPHVEV